MKIVVDENIPLVQELFAPLGTIVSRPGRSICAEDVRDADVLLVRSVTLVGEPLLHSSTVKFVGTCTIGTDHLDKHWLEQQGVYYASAPGCNAYGVVQYVLAAMVELGLVDTSLRVGIIGCGNVGGRLYRALKGVGFRCVCYDPFLRPEMIEDLSEWQDLFTCDLICTHTPLTKGGPHPTYHMIDSHFFEKMKHGSVLLNAGRGEVINNLALLHYLQGPNQNAIRVVLDVWEPEPDINTALLEKVAIASPHIAGYSFEGKTNGSLMIYRELVQYLGLSGPEDEARVKFIEQQAYGEPEKLCIETLQQAIAATYAIGDDDTRLREAKNALPAEFDQLRKHYPKRREFSHYAFELEEQALVQQLLALGFIRTT